MVPFEKAMAVSFRLTLHCDHCAISITVRSQFVIECLRCSNQQRVGHFGAKFGEEGFTYVSQILKRSGREMVPSYAKEIVSISSAV